MTWKKHEYLKELAKLFFAAKGATLRCRAKNPADLTRTIRAYFASDLMKIWSSIAAKFESLNKDGERFSMGFIEGCLRNK
jgi:hypothetical protein